ncbi:MAG: holo-ACP synthase [Candidatus Limnocylindrales bacterium]
MAGQRARSVSRSEHPGPGDGFAVEAAGIAGVDPGTGSTVVPARGVPGLGAAPPVPPQGTTELGIDIIRVSRIKDSLTRFGARFARRVLTPTEMAYVRGRPETMAGRWAAKEAVSKVLGLGVRGIGWRDIEIERLPTGQPAVKLHGRAARRAEQLGMSRVALSISHESEFAVAIAYGVRTAGGRFLYPPDIEDRLSEREASLMRRFERLREVTKQVAVTEAQLAAGAAGRLADRAPSEEGADA